MIYEILIMIQYNCIISIDISINNMLILQLIEWILFATSIDNTKELRNLRLDVYLFHYAEDYQWGNCVKRTFRQQHTGLQGNLYYIIVIYVNVAL